VVRTIFSGAPSANVINGLRNWGAALAIIASWALPASAPAAADDKPSGCKPMPENITVDATSPINIGVLANALFYYRCTDYDDQVKAVLNEASAWVAARAPGVDKPAIVLDIDETSLSNWPAYRLNGWGRVLIGECDLQHGPCGLRAWQALGQSKAIPPTLALARRARELGVAVFFISGRPASLHEATERNLREQGYEWTGLILLPDGAQFASLGALPAPAVTTVLLWSPNRKHLGARKPEVREADYASMWLEILGATCRDRRFPGLIRIVGRKSVRKSYRRGPEVE